MKRLAAILLSVSMLFGCSGSGAGTNDAPAKDENKAISFEVSIPHGDTFEFELIPENEVTYQELRDNIVNESISGSNWRSYFDLKDVYREHYEYDDDGNPTDVYQKGYTVSIILNDGYYYVDNWSRNGLEWQVFVDGVQSMTMTVDGKTDPAIVKNINDIESYSGADAMIIFSDFTDSWGEDTYQYYDGQLNNYEMISCSGDVKLLNSSVLTFKKLKDDIWYFAAYDSDEEFFVVFFQTNDSSIDREKEYRGAIYATNSYGELDPYTGYDVFTPWQAVVEMMKEVNK